MKICKICNNEILNEKRWVYCSDECVSIARKKARTKIADNERKKYIESKKNWTYAVVEINKVKHDNLIPLSYLKLSNSISTHLKLLLRDFDLTKKEFHKINRCDGMARVMQVVVVSPKMIEEMFYKKYEVYKQNFRLDCLRTVKTLASIFNLINNYDTKSNTK